MLNDCEPWVVLMMVKFDGDCMADGELIANDG